MLRRHPIDLFERAAALGDVVQIPLPRYPVLLLNRPDLAWEVLATRSHGVIKSPALRGARRILGNGLLTADGDHHARQRRLIQPIFHHERIHGHGATMVELCERTTARWVDGRRMDLHAEMARLTLEIVGATVFDTRVNDAGAAEIRKAMHDVLDSFDRLFSPLLPLLERLPLPATMRYRRGKEVFERRVTEMVAERRARGATGDDLLSLLIRAQEDGVGMSDQQIRDEAVTLFLAGHETTSNALAWTWHLLAGAPQAESRLHDELDRVLDGRPPTVSDLADLPYVEAVVSESMRLRPPAWAIGREVVEPFVVDAMRVDAGSVVVTSPWLLHHDPRWWGSDVSVYRPERWLEPSADRPRHAFLPFGGGPRMCIGEGFALMETRLLVASIARRWRFEPDPDHTVELQPVITLRPRTGLRVTARRRGS